MASSTKYERSNANSGTPAGIGNAFLGKVPPHSSEAELSVLGGILLKTSSLDVVADIVQPQDFYSEANGLIYQAILDLNVANKPVDLINLGEILKDRGELDSVGGLTYLSSLLDAVPTSANIESHAHLVAEKASVRACIGAALDILEKGYGEYGDAETYLDQSEQAVFEAARKRSKSRMQDIYTAVKTTFSEIERLQKAKTDITGVPTGYHQLDRMTTGLQHSDLIVVAGRPSMGKTALAMNIAVNAAMKANVGTVIFSLEMSVDQLMRRLLSAEASVSSNRLRLPRTLTRDDMFHLVDAADRLYKAPIFLDDSAEINVLEIRSRARRLKARADIGLIIVDYLQIMQTIRSGRGDTSRDREVAEITRSLKALAKELQVPVIVLSQLNRGPESRQDKRPLMADLRESGAIEQDADQIMFLYRDSFYDRDSTDQSAEVILGKNRNGPVGTVKLLFQGEFTRFDNIEANESYASMPGGETQFVPDEQAQPPEDLPPLPPLGDDDDEAPF